MTTTYEPGIQRIATGEVEWSEWECTEQRAREYALEYAERLDRAYPGEQWEPIVREVVR